jgi:precorrin-6A/cobalt-precorrin-6A reductase
LAVRGRRVLILGGTREARELASLLVEAGAEPVISLAGLTGNPAHSRGAMRSGGFGGVQGLSTYLEREHFEAIVDATHPFAIQISAHAAEAARQCEIPIMRLERPPWYSGPDDRWLSFADCQSAAAALRDGRVLLTIGRKELAPFFARPTVTGVARVIEPPAIAVPPGWKLIRGRPPFPVGDELALMEGEEITVLVAKNSGGEDTRAKLDAARYRRIPVFMIERPRKPNIATATTPEAILPLLSSLLRA